MSGFFLSNAGAMMLPFTKNLQALRLTGKPSFFILPISPPLNMVKGGVYAGGFFSSLLHVARMAGMTIRVMDF
jgi:hypothetical protein